VHVAGVAAMPDVVWLSYRQTRNLASEGAPMICS